MQRTEVESTTLRSVGYESAERILELEFTSGAVYQYFDVPESVWQGLLKAESKGKYFNREIRDDYSALPVRASRRGSRTRRAGR